MRIIRQQAPQAHYVPSRVNNTTGLFNNDPSVLFDRTVTAEPEIIWEYDPALNEDGSTYAPGATVQNNFNPPVYLRCAVCMMRVLSTETENHICEGYSDGETA